MKQRFSCLWPALFTAAVLFAGCRLNLTTDEDQSSVLVPSLTSNSVWSHAEDPAIWVNPTQVSQSLVLGTDMALDGAVYAFSVEAQTTGGIEGIRRPSNVDVDYLLVHGTTPTPIMAVTDGSSGLLRIYRLPDFTPLDKGGIPVTDGSSGVWPTGVALYRRGSDGELFAIVSRNRGSRNGYLTQYRLATAVDGSVYAEAVRLFGSWSGRGEIEAVAIDDELGFVYYADETNGIMKYHADPDAPDASTPLASFAESGFKGLREGIAVYSSRPQQGYLLVVEKSDTTFIHVYPREGTPTDLHSHAEIARIPILSTDVDGVEVSSVALGSRFTSGLLVVASGMKYDYYSWKDIQERIDSAHRP